MSANRPFARTRPRAAYWLALVLTPIVFLAGFASLEGPAHPAPAFRQDHAWISETAEFFAPSAEQACTGEPVALPHYTERAIREVRSAAFCLQFDIADPTRAHLALFLPDSVGHLSVSLNGWFVGDTGSMDAPLEFARSAPLWFALPDAALKAGRNVLRIRNTTEAGFAALHPVYIGDARTLRPAYDRAHLIRVGVIDATLVAMLIVSVLMAGLYVLRPSDSVYAWFAATIAVWALQLYVGNSTRPLVVNLRVWGGLHLAALGWFVCLACLFVHRLTGLRPGDRTRERLVLAFGAIVGTILIWPASLIHATGAIHLYVWVPGMLLIGLLILQRLARSGLREGNEEARMLLLAAVLVFAVGVHDYANDLRSAYRSGAFDLLPYTVAGVLVTYALFLLKRVTHALNRAETLNQELEDRVAEKAREIADFHARMRQLELQRATQQERERMTRDMHDGLGGQLIHALSIAETDPRYSPMREVLRSALSDLRMVIDSVEPVDGDLAAVLAMMRSRCERRVAQAGLHFDWQVADLPAMPQLAPDHVLQILRILDEAVTNVIRHAQARVVGVHARPLSPQTPSGPATHISVEVSDDGRGFAIADGQAAVAAPAGSGGRGLRHMRQRAEAIGAVLELRTDSRGTRVRLLLPVRLGIREVTPRVTHDGYRHKPLIARHARRHRGTTVRFHPERSTAS